MLHAFLRLHGSAQSSSPVDRGVVGSFKILNFGAYCTRWEMTTGRKNRWIGEGLNGWQV